MKRDGGEFRSSKYNTDEKELLQSQARFEGVLRGVEWFKSLGAWDPGTLGFIYLSVGWGAG